MYKFSNQLSQGKLVLVRKKLGEGTCAFLLLKTPTRKYAAPKPVPSSPVTKKSTKLLWGTVGVTVLTGAAVVYAKGNAQARNWLASNVPVADNFIALVYEENTTYGKAFSNQVFKVVGVLSTLLFGKEGVTPMELESRASQDLDKTGASIITNAPYKLPPPSFKPLYVEEKEIGTPEIEVPATLVQTDKCPPEKVEPIVISKDLVDLEQQMHVSTKIAIDSYKEATAACVEYNSALYKVIEASVEDLDSRMFSTLAGHQNARDSALKKAKDASAQAKCAIQTLERMLKAGVPAPPEAVAATKRYLVEFFKDLETAEKKYKAVQEKSVISDRYWQKVEDARKVFKDELQSLFPGIDLSSRQLDVRGDTDLLLVYMMKQVQFLQNEIAELQTIREQKLSRAIECNHEQDIIDAKVEDAIKKERAVREAEYLKKCLVIQAEADRQLREALKKQIELQQDVLRDRLDKKEKEIMGKFAKSVSEQVEKERVIFKQEMAAMAGKLTAIENTLKQRAKAEADAKQSQTLWLAAESLLAATKRGCKDSKIDKEITAVEKAGKDDKLVQAVLKGISDDVRNNAIVTEQSLQRKFDQMERTALKVALVGKDGAKLPVYFLSWIQSKLLFSRISEIPLDELENKPTDFSSLDTFEIMQRARYYMDHGNIPAALRYVNLLQGAPKVAAKTWCTAARSHLEIKQAAEAVMAHAAASSMIKSKK